jgi:phosphatidylserine/phosphatidylglycerophosphate/cardiolipin synthase-like enzyme
MKMNRKFVAGTILVSVILLTSTAAEAVSGELTVTPLLDTPENRVYYNHLIEEIRGAKDSIKVMMSTADNYPKHPDGIQNELFDALGVAADRGVKVRVLLDESDFSSSITETNKTTAKLLRDRGLKVKLDDPKVTTHAKLIVIDDRTVIVGSSNWNYPSYTETYQSNVKLTGERVAVFYSRVFDAVWAGESFEKVKLPELPEGSSIVPLISTGENRSYYNMAKELIKGARESIYLVVFKITRYPEFQESKSNQLLKTLVEAKQRGVDIRIILDVNSWSDDVNQSNRETALWLLGQGVENVSFDSLTSTTHSKVLIVDGNSVLLGSTNWSYYSLSKNLEADILLKNTHEVGRAYQKYFEKLWKKTEVPSRKELSGNLEED